jgi:hypothetical protein
MGTPHWVRSNGLHDIKPEWKDNELNKLMDEAIAEINKLAVPEYKADKTTQEILQRWNQDAEALKLRSKGIVRK